jgi:hypothetical protein
VKSIRSNPRNHAAEGDERIRTAVPAPSTDPAYELLADMAEYLRRANYWDEISECLRCVSCDTRTEQHEDQCEIAALLAREEASRG